MAVRNRILSIGVELEGGWRANAGPTDIRHDGSLKNLEDVRVGEVSCNPLVTTREVADWMRANYPHKVNETCGFHVHVALNKLNYSRLMERSFNDMFYQRMGLFVERNRDKPGFALLATRLAGINQYCQKLHSKPELTPENQLFLREQYGLSRYAALNFCFGRHGTLECRVFPCFPNVEDSVAGMEVFCEIVNTFLAQCSPEKPVSVSLSEKDIPQDIKPKSIHTKHVLDYRFQRT